MSSESTEPVTRRLAAILAADMVGYSRLMQEDETGTLDRQKACFADLIRPKIREYEGRIVKTTGDGLLAEFPSAVGAVLCAVEVQREMTRREAAQPEDRRISYRVGINMGDVIHDGDDIFGDGVNVAARLESLSPPGGICISETVFNTVRGKLDLGFADLGPKQVKNIAEPVASYEVLLNPGDVGKLIDAQTRKVPLKPLAIALVLIAAVVAGGFFLYGARPTTPTLTKHILVLPVRAADASAEILADAVSENLWLTLPRMRGLTTVPRSTATELRGVTPDAALMATLGPVTHELSGTVAVNGDEITLTSSLRAVGSASPVWEQRTTTSPDALFANLSRHKLDLMSALNLPLIAQERAVLQDVFTANHDAFLKYAQAEALRATRHWNDLAAALRLFREAHRLDPDFIAAQEGYAFVNYYAWHMSWSVVRYTPEAIAEFARLSDDLLARDPNNATAIGLQSLVRLNRLDGAGALAQIRGAIFLDRNDPALHLVHGHVLTTLGHRDDALQAYDQYLDLAPRLSRPEAEELAWYLLRLEEPARALEVMNRLDADGNRQLSALLRIAEAKVLLGQLEEANTLAGQIKTLYPPANTGFITPIFKAFADPTVHKRYIATMGSIGIPYYPFALDRAWQDHRLTNAELVQLHSRDFEAVDTADPLGGLFENKVTADGRMTFRYGFLGDMAFRGTWEIEGDKVCVRLTGWAMGHRTCDPIFRDPERWTPDNPRYIYLSGFGPHYFGIRFLSD